MSGSKVSVKCVTEEGTFKQTVETVTDDDGRRFTSETLKVKQGDTTIKLQSVEQRDTGKKALGV